MQDSDGMATLGQSTRMAALFQEVSLQPEHLLGRCVAARCSTHQHSRPPYENFRPTPPQENFCMGVGTDNGNVRDPDTGLREKGHGADQSDAVITVDHTRSPFCHTGEEFYRRSAAQHAQHLVVCLLSLPAPACSTRISEGHRTFARMAALFQEVVLSARAPPC